ncbi:MAG: AI-2E family transporter [Deltaproteobacteria bacterium]|nr:AI-2E family transporter [Deltaproteobacteria bacterium]
MSERISFLTLLAFLCLAVLWLFRPFLSVILLAATFVISLWPLYASLNRLFRGHRWIASFVVTLFLALVLIFPVAFVISLVIEQAVALAHFLPETMQAWLPLVKEYSHRFNLPISWEAILPQLVQQGAQFVSQFSPKLLMQTTQFLLNFALTLLLVFFLFIEGPALYENLLHLSPLKESYETHLSREIRNTLNACLYGYILTAISQGILAGIGFTIAKIPIAALLGVATIVTSFIPIIGAAGIWIPVTVYLLLTQQWGMGIFLGLYGALLISGIDNLIKPLIIQGKTRIHPFLIFLAIFGGLQALGPVGLLVGPIIVAIFLACVKIYKKDFLEQT